MDRSAATRGTTLVELVFVLCFVAVLTATGLPPLRHGLDALAVAAAREGLAAGIARTRSIAIAHGGATLVLESAGARYWIEPDGGPGFPAVDLRARYRVDIAVDGADGGRVELRFDGLGIGRLANRTLRLERGRAQAALTLSSYGRVRRW